MNSSFYYHVSIDHQEAQCVTCSFVTSRPLFLLPAPVKLDVLFKNFCTFWLVCNSLSVCNTLSVCSKRIHIRIARATILLFLIWVPQVARKIYMPSGWHRRCVLGLGSVRIQPKINKGGFFWANANVFMIHVYMFWITHPWWFRWSSLSQKYCASMLFIRSNSNAYKHTEVGR